MGRLNSGIPQIPIRQPVNPKPPSEMVINHLRNKAVTLLKCGPDANSRLLYLSQILLTDAAETGNKIRIVCTVQAGRHPKEFAELVAHDRNENVKHFFVFYLPKFFEKYDFCFKIVLKSKQHISLKIFHLTKKYSSIFFQVSSTIGFQDRLESQVSPMTLMTFCQNDVLLRSLMGNDSILASLTHVIIDSVDENDRFSDLVLLVFREALPRYRIKLILLSGSENPGICKNYFPQCNIAMLNEEPLRNAHSGQLVQQQKYNEEVNFMILCLYAKLLAQPGFPIADFLARISNPPTFNLTRLAVQALKTIEALNCWEDITELGNHLLDLPVEPKLGKMILLSVPLKCLDPVLTIAACLCYT
jgi:hypothetical protein